ncbi:tyrosine-type recombinase/integrase [Clostridium sp. D2Q-11]|uniref:Tyrosine-type recombinase/integrase n=1 Tax=Anaeromonas frigoriresistens TaxID=2683708 RepID=A0A942UZ35_9FIRM|nr:tyrosine-type recombinase/integrase [Anaeromonas frigoriresistens]MBS4539651.1 tyrosine-type recombinase/integrase [Anaeromonas frigoriresistens]
MITRPIDLQEYKEIMKLITDGFTYQEDGKTKNFRPNQKLFLALILQANLGLRIGDVLSLKVSNFRNGKLILEEEKTSKIQNRKVNPQIIELIKDYAIENSIKSNQKLFNRFGVRAVQKQLRIITDYLELSNISTHSFRKMYAILQYQNNNNNIELVKELLNHSSIATTQRYIRVHQEEIDKASESICIM